MTADGSHCRHTADIYSVRYYYRDISKRVTSSINRAKGEELFSSPIVLPSIDLPSAWIPAENWSRPLTLPPYFSPLAVRATSKRIKKLEKQCSRIRRGARGGRGRRGSRGVRVQGRIYDFSPCYMGRVFPFYSQPFQQSILAPSRSSDLPIQRSGGIRGVGFTAISTRIDPQLIPNAGYCCAGASPANSSRGYVSLARNDEEVRECAHVKTVYTLCRRGGTRFFEAGDRNVLVFRSRVEDLRGKKNMRVKGTTHINRQTINSWVSRAYPSCAYLRRDRFRVKHGGRGMGGKGGRDFADRRGPCQSNRIFSARYYHPPAEFPSDLCANVSAAATFFRHMRTPTGCKLLLISPFQIQGLSLQSRDLGS